MNEVVQGSSLSSIGRGHQHESRSVNVTKVKNGFIAVSIKQGNGLYQKEEHHVAKTIEELVAIIRDYLKE